MKIRAIKRHKAADGNIYAPGDEYTDNETNAKAKIAAGMVEEVKAKKAAPENKKAPKPENKAD